MLGTIVNIFRIRDLRNKILFTVALLIIYRVGFHIPVPGFDNSKVVEAATQSNTPFGRAAEMMRMFTGGTLRRSSLFGMGIMPYITASIILMLLGEVIPALKKLRQEGQTGHKKIQEYTRYLTVLICMIQAMMFMKLLGGQQLIYGGWQGRAMRMGVVGMTAGTIFLMWLGEQIDEYGIGNGISLIIMAGIVARMPWVVYEVWQKADFTLTAPAGSYGPPKILFLVAAFVGVVAGAILITQGQRRIPIQQAKQMRGRRMYGGQRHYLPLRVNHGGVMPIIFASSFMMFPPIIFQRLANAFPESDVTVQFQPKEMAKNLRDAGSFIPGLRPGRRTAEYLETVMTRITYYGAAFLAIIAVIPTVVSVAMGIDYGVTSYLGGTGLLIVVSVSLDLVQKIEANLLMRSYEGFSSAGFVIIFIMMTKAIHKAPKEGFVLDGFPRTVNQARELDKSMADAGKEIDFVVNLEVDDRIIESRITGRRSCPKCGAVYHVENMKPKNDNVCDNDGTELVQRPDDTPEVVENRLKNYHQQTEPLVDYYKNSGTVYDVRADRDPDVVKNDIFDLLESAK
ncbi:MAG: preprotein translocase subunit SecY [Sedimentisphaerales bacterium]